MKFDKFIYELKTENVLKKRDLICIIISFVAIISISLQMFYSKRSIVIISAISSFSSIIIFNYCAIINKKEIVGSKLQNKELEIKNNNLTEITDTVRCFKHDFNNIIQAIDGYILVKDISSLQKYVNCLVDECDRINLVDVLNSQLSKSPAICGVLLNKLKIAEKKNIKMNVEILVNLNTLNEKSYLISRMLGILIDNAIEASSSCNDNRIVNIRFSSSTKDGNKNIIRIENTYSERNIDTNKIFEKNYSTKIGNSGLGLWKIKDILNKDSAFGLFTTMDDNVFKQELEIYINEENAVLLK